MKNETFWKWYVLSAMTVGPIAVGLSSWLLYEADMLIEYRLIPATLFALTMLGFTLGYGLLFSVARRSYASVLSFLLGLIRPRFKAKERVQIRGREAEATGARGIERKHDGKVPRPELQARERLAVGVMTQEFKKSLASASLALFVALVFVGGYGAWTRDRGMLVVGAATAFFFLLAVARQVVFAWRVESGNFGSREHEVRELLAFAMRHPTPDDFFDDNGHLLPAFDLRPDDALSEAAVGEPVVATI